MISQRLDDHASPVWEEEHQHRQPVQAVGLRSGTRSGQTIIAQHEQESRDVNVVLPFQVLVERVHCAPAPPSGFARKLL